LTLPKILPARTEEDRDEALRTLREFVEDARLRDLKPDLEKLRSAIEGPHWSFMSDRHCSVQIYEDPSDVVAMVRRVSIVFPAMTFCEVEMF
jgi:hypothetical protein